MARKRTQQRTYFEAQVGPFDSVHETAPVRPPSVLRVSRNMMPDRISGGSWCTRPGFGDPNGLAGRTYGRAVRQLSTSWGGEYSIYFLDDRFIASIAEIAATEQTLGGGVSITAMTPATPAKFLIGTTQFRDLLVVTDSVNLPWTWDPLTDTYTLLTNASVARARPTTYYGKVFFIKDDDPKTLIWSEEGDPETGYEAGGYSNAWELTQTSGEYITAILGTNEALFYWKQSSFDMIRGEVDANFSTSGTVAGVHSEIGTRSSHAILLLGNKIWFIDQYGNPQRYFIGGEIEPIWQAAQHTLKFVDVPNLPMASVAHFTDAGVVVFLIPSTLAPAGTLSNMALAFDDASGAYLGTWSDTEEVSEWDPKPIDAHVLGTVKRYKRARMAHLGGVPCKTWVWHLPVDTTDASVLGYYQDRYSGGVGGSGQPIVTHLISGPVGEGSGHKVFDRLTVSLAGGQTVTNLNIAYRTAEGGERPPQTITATGLVETGSFPVPHAEQKVTVGTIMRSRWIQPRLSHASTAEILSVNHVAIRGMYDSSDPYGI